MWSLTFPVNPMSEWIWVSLCLHSDNMPNSIYTLVIRRYIMWFTKVAPALLLSHHISKWETQNLVFIISLVLRWQNILVYFRSLGNFPLTNYMCSTVWLWQTCLTFHVQLRESGDEPCLLNYASKNWTHLTWPTEKDKFRFIFRFFEHLEHNSRVHYILHYSSFLMLLNTFALLYFSRNSIKLFDSWRC